MALDTDGDVSVADGVVRVTGASRMLVVVTSSTSGADFCRERSEVAGTGIGNRAARNLRPRSLGAVICCCREHEADLRGCLAGWS